MIGKRLRELRESAGETRLSLASAVKTTPSTIYNIETGASNNPHLDLVVQLANHFGVSVDYLSGNASKDAEAIS